MTTREMLHHMVDTLPEPALSRAARLLAALEDEEAALPAVLRDAPLDDEEETDDERTAVAEAYAEIAAGVQPFSHEDVKRTLGL